jgi:hypothetical protein
MMRALALCGDVGGDPDTSMKEPKASLQQYKAAY